MAQSEPRDKNIQGEGAEESANSRGPQSNDILPKGAALDQRTSGPLKSKTEGSCGPKYEATRWKETEVKVCGEDGSSQETIENDDLVLPELAQPSQVLSRWSKCWEVELPLVFPPLQEIYF